MTCIGPLETPVWSSGLRAQVNPVQDIIQSRALPTAILPLAVSLVLALTVTFTLPPSWNDLRCDGSIESLVDRIQTRPNHLDQLDPMLTATYPFPPPTVFIVGGPSKFGHKKTRAGR